MFTKTNKVNELIADTPQVVATRDLIQRVTPEIVSEFTLELIAQDADLDVYEIEQNNTGITLRGTNGVSLASAYYHYLKTYCHSHLSWCGDNIDIPSPLPSPEETIRIRCTHHHRVNFNYCTFNYSASWWDWERWEREIDFMAMNGINMPLATVGLEAVWYYALLDFGLSDEQARDFLVGPTFSSWQWMTNIQSHGAPLPKEWIDKRLELGKKIIKRQQDLGMTPITQGFSGYVPNCFNEMFPDARISEQRRWCAFERTSQLDPLDPLFMEFGHIFLHKSLELLGTAHYYAVDPFHENRPIEKGADYLHKVGKRIFELMRGVDPEAQWVMQSWSIREEIARAVPIGDLLILDLKGEKNSFWGHRFVKGQLHNFGGRTNMHGDLKYLAGNPFAKCAQNIEACVGMGMFMEGIDQNPVFYDLAYDMIWREKKVDLKCWLQDYAQRRYGAVSDHAIEAWNLLLEGPYQRGTNGVEYSSIVAARPALHIKKSGPNAGFKIPYNPLDLIESWRLLLADKEKIGNSKGYRFDIMDIGRQVLSNLGQPMQLRIAAAYRDGNCEVFEAAVERFHELLLDIDRLVSTRTEYSFGTWLSSARSWGKCKELQDYYSWNASMLVTLWGPEENPIIFDYAWREWAGLIRTYYLPRWEKFHTFLAYNLKHDLPYTDPDDRVHGRETFRANDFYSELADWELSWVRQDHNLPSEAVGDTIQVAQTLFDKYAGILTSTYKEKIRN